MRSTDAQAEAQEAFRELAGLDVDADQVCDRPRHVATRCVITPDT